MSQPSMRLFLLLIVVALSASLVGAAKAAPPSQALTCTRTPEAVATPLNDLGSRTYTRRDGQVTNFTGGLYPNGSNTPPAAHQTAALAAARLIQPLDSQGRADPTRGRIVMVSIGMSNASAEFSTFMSLVDADTSINPRLTLVNGALPNLVADRWVDPTEIGWQNLDQQLINQQINPLQVQVAWVKNTLTGGGDFPAKAQQLQAAFEAIARNLKDRFPNLRIAYYSSRTNSYTYNRGLSPEPLAYETGFAVKWMIEKQISGDMTLNYDPARGDVDAPLLLWGPYLWADGPNPRSDGLVWLGEDMTDDCTHPSQQGRQKVAQMLMNFFKTDSTTQGWFLSGGSVVTLTPGTGPTATRTPTPRVTTTTTPPGSPRPIYIPLIIGTSLTLAGLAGFLLHLKR